MTSLTQLAPGVWLDLGEVERVHTEPAQVASPRPRLGEVPRYAVDVVLRARHGGVTRVRVPGTDQRMSDDAKDRVVQSWMRAHLGPIVPDLEPLDVPGKCGERDCPEPHP